MNKEKRLRLYPWTWEQLSFGRMTFTTEQGMQALDVSRGAFHDAAEKLQHKNRLICPRRGFYVIVSPRWLKLGAPPPDLYIDELMQFEGHPYYVALRQAANIHGVSVPESNDFQVMTDKRMPVIESGQSRIVFFYRKNINVIEEGVEVNQTYARSLRISSPELTVLELLSYLRAIDGIDHVVSILNKLGPKLNAKKLADLSGHFSAPSVQRVGYLLDWLGYADCVKMMRGRLYGSKSVSWKELNTTKLDESGIQRQPLELNKEWRIVVRTELTQT